MSNTGRNKRLASFNCDAKLWDKFMKECQKEDTTATAVLTDFIGHYLDGSLDELAASLDKISAKGKKDWEEQIKSLVDAYLEQRLPDYLNKYAVSQPNSHPSRPTKVAKPQKEFWVARERAKFLDIEVTANQLLHIDMYAKEAYKERHSTLPKMQIFRGTQTYTFPNQDVDILDDAIHKVTSW